MRTLLLALVAVTLGAQEQPKPEPKSGPRGGCYVVTTGKDGKPHKKYISKENCKEGKQ